MDPSPGFVAETTADAPAPAAAPPQRASDSLPQPAAVDHHTTAIAHAMVEAAAKPQPQAVDYDALAKQSGAVSSSVDYDDLAKQSGAISSAPQSASQQLGIKNPWGAAPIDFLEGIGSGVMSTIYHGGDLIRRATGMPRIIDTPEAQARMGAPDSIAGKAGKFGEQAAEFAAPMGAVSKATQGAHLLMRMGAEGLAAAGVSGVQSGGDPGSMAAGGATGAAGPALGAAIPAIGKTRLPQMIYQSALKPTWAMAKGAGIDMLSTGIKEQIPVSATGLAKAGKMIDDIQGEISKGVQLHAAQGRTVDTAEVLKSLDGLEDFYRNTAAPEKALKTLADMRLQFEQYHGQHIPLDVAQKIKINTYQELKQSYGEMASAKVEGLKQVARGLKEQISSVFPEISGLNERQSKLLDLSDALYRAVWRIENHQMMGIGSTGAATAGHALMGGPGAAVGFVGKVMLDDPGVKSKLAIALAQSGVKNPTGVVTARMAALKAAMEKAASSLAAGQNGPSGQLVPAPGH